jgi:hypothetical protein
MWNLRGSRSASAIFAVYKTMAGGAGRRGRTLQSVGGRCERGANAAREVRTSYHGHPAEPAELAGEVATSALVTYLRFLRRTLS